MAVVTKFGEGNTVFVLASLDQDWEYSADFPAYIKGIRVRSIQYIPTGINDVAVLKCNATSNGAEIFYNASLNKFPIKYYYGERLKPFYDVSDTNTCTASGTAKFIIHLGGDGVN